MIIKRIIQIFLLCIIPLIVLGFNVFEKTPIYSALIKISGAEQVLRDKLSTNFGKPKQLIITQRNEIEFDHIWKLIKDNTKYQLPSWTPQIISRLALENGTYINHPNGNKIILVPDNSPVFAFKQSTEKITSVKVSEDDYFMVGTIEEIEEWIQKKRENNRVYLDIIITVISMFLGIALEFGWKK